MRPAPSWASVVLVAVAATVLAGCRLDLVAEATVARDGSGTATVRLALDPAMLAELDDLGIDPTAELTAAAPAAPDWDVARAAGDDGTLVVTISQDADDADALGDAFRDLTAGLAPDDPALEIDLHVAVDGDGAATLTGRAGLRPPATAGATRDGAPVGPAGDELAALVAEVVQAQLVVELPGPVVDHDADDRDGRTLMWQLPVGADRQLTAVSSAPPLVPVAVVVAGAGIVAVVVAGLVVRWLRRRRR